MCAAAYNHVMPGKRDYISEIHDRRLRVGSPNNVILMFDRQAGLLRELDKSGDISDELMRYFPIAMVACIETYTRSMVQDLVDAGAPFAERLDAFENIKLDMSTMKAIHGQRITLGELIAHVLPVNNLDDVKRVIGALLGVDLIELVKNARDRWKSRGDAEADDPIVGDIGKVIRGVEWTFRLRHMYAHEFPAANSINRELIDDSVRACAMFLTAADEGIRNLRFPDAPRTQAEMNSYTAAAFQSADRDLGEMVADFCANLSDKHRALLVEAQSQWMVVRDRTAHLMADMEAQGGSMWPMVYNRYAEAATSRRRDEILSLIRLGW
jgi:uncharacterized protein YecT (DUF1311 family)